MSEEKKFTGFNFIEGMTPDDLRGSDNVVLDILKAAAKQDSVGGKMIAHGMQMTGSQGEAFKMAVEAYSTACNPIFEKVLEHMSDENFRNDLKDRLIQTYGSSINKKKGS